jgi:hypothetical protein
VKWNFVLSGCCLLLLAANIALVRQNGQLKDRLALPPPVLEATIGAKMPDLRGFDIAGQPLEILYGNDSRKVLVLVFSPTCPFCDQNWHNWEQVIGSLDRSAVRPVAVDVTSTTTAPFVAQHQLGGLPVFVRVDPRATVDYRFHLTPQTILLDPAGKIEKVWTGVLNDSALSDLKHRLGENKTAEAARHPQGL